MQINFPSQTVNFRLLYAMHNACILKVNSRYCRTFLAHPVICQIFANMLAELWLLCTFFLLEWGLVAILKGSSVPPAAAVGDLSNCLDNNCKLSDEVINALQFSILKFEPAHPSDSTPVTYFDFRGREFSSSKSVPACGTPWTLDETDALSGKFDGQESCCTFDVCNFGRGHCANTVKSSYGFKGYGGCGGWGPIIGTTGVQEGTSLRISVLWTASTPTKSNSITDREDGQDR